MVSKILNKSAQPIPCTVNPGTSQAASKIKLALITRVNKPKLIKLMGRVKISSTGFIRALTTPKIIAVIRAAVEESIVTPLNI